MYGREEFLDERYWRIVVAACAAAAGEDSALSTITGRCRNSSPGLGFSGPPVETNRCCGTPVS